MKRFKQFKASTAELRDLEVTLVAAPNNAGKSTLLHGLAVWEFCRTVIEMEKGSEALLKNHGTQGVGLAYEEFTPISVPTLSHLWTNLNSQKESEGDGYTLRIRSVWRDVAGESQYIEFGLALSNDRIFVKACESSLAAPCRLPRAGYLPPFAGISELEEPVSPASRRRLIGRGLAGSVIRNLLLDLYKRNVAERARFRGDKSKLSDADLRYLRENDGWELLQQSLREIFTVELNVKPFNEEYHRRIDIKVVRGSVVGYKLTRFPKSKDLDLMVMGSGFLQWLGVYSLAVSHDVDVLLLDEPDAHLHPQLQASLVSRLRELAMAKDKQVIMTSHSTELIKTWPPEEILQVTGSQGFKHLTGSDGKVALLAGLGSSHAPILDSAAHSGKLFFVEGQLDAGLLRVLAGKLGHQWFESVTLWPQASAHSERASFARSFRAEYPHVRVAGLRDLDDESIGSVDLTLQPTGRKSTADYRSFTWRRRNIENYLLVPRVLALVTGRSVEEINGKLADDFGLAVGANFTDQSGPELLRRADGKTILSSFQNKRLALEVANHLAEDEIAKDIVVLFEQLRGFFDV